MIAGGDKRRASIVGHFDGIDGARAVGWAADLEAPERVLDVEFFSVAPDGRMAVLGRAGADRPRPDLQSIRLTQTDHGFAWPIPRVARGCRLGARIPEGNVELPGGPVEVPPEAPPRLAGHFDRVAGGRAVGWAADLNAPRRVLEVEFFTVAPDGQATALGRTRADRPRPDLRDIGVRQIAHGFDWPIPRLAAAARLGARVAGGDFELPGGPIELDQQSAARFAGQLDRVDGSRVVGWAADPAAPERVLEVEFFALAPNEPPVPLGRARANRPRADLPSVALAQTGHGFEWRLPYRKAYFQLSARIADEAFELPGSPVAVTPRPLYEGAFDGIARGVLRGWAWAWDPAIEVAVEVLVDGRLRAAVPARAARADLKLAHIGDGRHGFVWVVPDEFSDGEPHEFACRIAGTPVWLGGSPRTAVVPPGPRSPGLADADAIRGHGPRPPPRGDAPAEPLLSRWQDAGDLARPPLAADRGALGTKRVRLLIAVWGADYIARFCRTALPSLLSADNLPHLARLHPVEVAFLGRAGERALVEASPAFGRLRTVAAVGFIAIDDILARYFEPAAGGYPTALTYAFYRGVQAAGAAALETDFIFWNADFVAADGVFRTLAELIAAGVRCTFAPSLRVDSAAEEALSGCRSADGSILTIGPRQWVELALRFPHPTVRAQTLNRYEERMIDTVNQLYWQIDDKLIVARVFLMFMLHLRPERLWEEVYGDCDYVFAPEMVPSSDYHYVTQSDRILLIELQHDTREGGDIVYGDAPMTPAEVASGVARWTTREHRRASQHLVVFNAADVEADIAPIRRMTDDFMDRVYQAMPQEPIWHNGHFFWTDSLAALGIPYVEPGPDHPRSHLAAALRGTGHDIDVLRESWPTPPGPPPDIFALSLPFEPGFDPLVWLATAQARYLRDWLDAKPASLTQPAAIDLVAGRFEGFGWGLVERCAAGWARRLGPDGCASLLLRLRPGTAVSLSFGAAEYPPGRRPGRRDALRITVNGRNATPLWSGRNLQIEISRTEVRRERGRLRIDLSTQPAAGEPAQPALSFRTLACRLE